MLAIAKCVWSRSLNYCINSKNLSWIWSAPVPFQTDLFLICISAWHISHCPRAWGKKKTKSDKWTLAKFPYNGSMIFTEECKFRNWSKWKFWICQTLISGGKFVVAQEIYISLDMYILISLLPFQLVSHTCLSDIWIRDIQIHCGTFCNTNRKLKCLFMQFSSLAYISQECANKSVKLLRQAYTQSQLIRWLWNVENMPPNCLSWQQPVCYYLKQCGRD